MSGAKGQEGQGKQNITTDQTAGFAVWEDPEGRFTIEYPSNWTAQGKANRFENIELRLVSPAPDIINDSSSLPIQRIIIDLYNKGETLRYSLLGNSSSSLNDICHNVIKNHNQGPKYFDLEEPLNFTKYTIDGHEACSYLYTNKPNGQDQIQVVQSIISVINGTEFDFVYATSPESYDITIPLINNIVNSIHILKT